MVNVSARIFLDRIGCRLAPRVFRLGGFSGLVANAGIGIALG